MVKEMEKGIVAKSQSNAGDPSMYTSLASIAMSMENIRHSINDAGHKGQLQEAITSIWLVAINIVEKKQVADRESQQVLFESI